jgi:hypothetical protein
LRPAGRIYLMTSTGDAAASRAFGPSLSKVGEVLRLVGAGLLAWSAALHIYLWHEYFHRVPTIGPLFIAQGLAAMAVAVAIVAFRHPVLELIGALLLAATAGALLLSVWNGLFGYKERLGAPYVGMSLAVEISGAVVLLLAAASHPAGHRSR